MRAFVRTSAMVRHDSCVLDATHGVLRGSVGTAYYTCALRLARPTSAPPFLSKLCSPPRRHFRQVRIWSCRRMPAGYEARLIFRSVGCEAGWPGLDSGPDCCTLPLHNGKRGDHSFFPLVPHVPWLAEEPSGCLFRNLEQLSDRYK